MSLCCFIWYFLIGCCIAVTFDHTSSVPPSTFVSQCAEGNRIASSLKKQFYFLPNPQTTNANVLIFDSSTSSWSNVSIPQSTNIMNYLKESTMTAATSLNGTDYLVVSGGKSSSDQGTAMINVYDITNDKWMSGGNMEAASWNSCSVQAEGSVFFATGAESNALKPSPEERRIQRFNLSTMTIDAANNMEKERDGAGCCYGAGRIFYGGGEDAASSTPSLTDQVEIWLPSLVRVKFVWDLSSARKSLVSVYCGGYIVFAGGKDNSENVYGTVDVFNASFPNSSNHRYTFNMKVPIWYGSIACINDEYVLISGGYSDHGGTQCSNAINYLDVLNLPAEKSVLPVLNFTLSQSTVYASAFDADKAMFFNGVQGDIIYTDS